MSARTLSWLRVYVGAASDLGAEVGEHGTGNDRDIRGASLRVSAIDGTAELHVRAGVGPDELIRILATYIPERARLDSVGQEVGGTLAFRFSLG